MSIKELFVTFKELMSNFTSFGRSRLSYGNFLLKILI